jgi:hypothetical protein
VITRDFGRTLLADKIVEINQRSDALSALKQAAQVETGYGGGFVNGIDGLRTGHSIGGTQKEDWFYYVNGLAANIGAADYPLSGGDIQQWDFHSWSFRHLIPAMIGHFPEPFKSGCGQKTFPTLVVYQADLEEQAEEIKSYLIEQGVKNVQVTADNRLDEKDKGNNNLIVLAGPQNRLVSELNRQWKRLGFFAYFENDRLVTVDGSGNPAAEYARNAGIIQATQNPWNPNGIGADENAAWVITGSDEKGLKSAVDCFIRDSARWRFSYGMVTGQAGVTKLP